MALVKVQSTGKTVADGVASCAITFTTLPTVGNGIIVVALTNGAGDLVTGVTDNRSNSYYLAKSQASGDGRVFIYYCPIVVTSSAPFTITIAASVTYFVATAIEVSGVGTGLGVDQSAGQSSSGTSVSTTTSPALTVDEVFLVAAVSVDGSTFITVESVSPTWTEEAEETNFAHAVGEIDSRVVTGVLGGTVSCSWTNSSSFTWSAAIVAFAPASTSARLSQLPVEVGILSDAPISLRVSQLPVEVAILDSTPIQLRLSQLPIEVLINTSIIPPTSTETTQFLIVMP